MKKFKLVAMGGTFDIIHKGHEFLLKTAFSNSDKVIIGLTSDDLAQKKGKKLLNNFSKRLSNLEEFLKKNFEDSSFNISKLENDFGPAVLEKEVEALVVSEETESKGEILNQMRKSKNLPSVEIVVAPMVLAKDGNRISTTRIRNLEINTKGEVL